MAKYEYMDAADASLVVLSEQFSESQARDYRRSPLQRLSSPQE